MLRKLRVCFVGVGSVARRHIRNLHIICQEKGLEIEIDAYRRCKNPVDGVKELYIDICEVPDGYDAIFITNPTEQHLASLEAFHTKGKHFFIEKPVVSLRHIEKAKDLRMRDGSVYYVACPLRYNAVIQHIKDHVDLAEVISVRCISSSYLPDWRPEQDYRTTYSSHKDMGGGVSIDLIHEWDYLTYLFGWPQKILHMTGKKSDLEIESDDYAIYIAEYPDMIAELHLDYFGRSTIREVQLFTKGETIVGDIKNHQIKFLSSGKIIDFHEERDDFQKRELEYFLDMVLGRIKIKNDYMHGIRVLELTQGRIYDGKITR